MALALEARGTMRLEQVMASAIEVADGFPKYAILRDCFISDGKATEQYEWSAKTYYPVGRIPEVGEMFRQPRTIRFSDGRVRCGPERFRASASLRSPAPSARYQR
jgi:gamma-glutamyltranspeptidase / glutathione hydrolase